MARKFSIVSWNIEHFRLKTTDHEKVVSHLKSLQPDIFALLEVEGKDVWRYMFDEFPDHSFFITEGKQTQEIMVGVHRRLRCFLTQRTEFKSGRTFLRPGLFLTVQIDGENYNLLFLHLKSMTNPEGFGLRDDMFQHAFRLKRVLDKAMGVDQEAKFLFMGDCNTMGLDYPYGQAIDASKEIRRLVGRARRNRMKLLPKDYAHTWTNGRGLYSDLDHVVASRTIHFQSWDGKAVKVVGWNHHPPGSAAFNEFVNQISDHCALYCEVH
ncbi:MAG: hypothetical protein O7E52_29220 [Candidatus Poribacteria bacterium]|nr:hypothetical protein [Candidatus Poribacteria bacterium]